jgi:hypothetical protein
MRRTVAGPVVALVLTASLVACGDGDGTGGAGPTRSPTLELPDPTRSGTVELPDPTRTGAPEDTTEPEPSRTPTREPEPSDRSADAPAESQDATQDDAADGDATADDATPTWLWWLLAAVVLAAVVAIPLLLRSRRRTAWGQQLSEAEGELGWLARELLPGLRHARSHEEVAGGWAVASPRIIAAEDRLTALESSAYDDRGRDRARALRDASRLARLRMEQLVGPGPHDTWSLDLDAIMADLEATLGPMR